ncbi:hypothetical protein R1sor_024829 [Riccia sorocarpa]|uniref:Uncharacterized protein n=1 Tax=Riccia sorocarpa TaxID=122646 RepID=A0ABD3GRM2_9MARC
MKESEFVSSSSTEWLILSERGLDLVSTQVKDGSKKTNERVKDALAMIGLLNYIWRIYTWQQQEICCDFVLHWNETEKKTVVNGLEIDVSGETFVKVTGLETEENSGDADQEDLFSEYVSLRSLQRMREGNNYESTGVLLTKFREPWLRDLLTLLSVTVGMECNNLNRAAPHVIQLVFESVSDNQFRRNQMIHYNFTYEVSRMQSMWESSQRRPIREETAAGPVMCFLYAHAILTRSLASVDGLLWFAGEKTMRIAIEFPGGKTKKITFEGERRVPSKSVIKSVGLEEECLMEEASAGLTSLEVTSRELAHPAKRNRLLEQCLPSRCLPTDLLTLEGWAAKVLELECTIARQNAELAENRLRLFTQGTSRSVRDSSGGDDESVFKSSFYDELGLRRGFVLRGT